MPGTTTNRGYITYDRVTDVDQLFIDFRDDTSGSTSASNIYKIDADVQGAYDDIVALQGTGWVSTETVHSNSTAITSLKSKTFYQALGTASVANTYIADVSGITSYYTGLNIIFTSASANTGNCTVNINGLGAVTLTKMNSSGTTVSLTANDISNGNYSGFTYNGTVFVALWLGENSAIKINGVANAANEITISNSVTGAAPTVATTGTDTNINLNLVSKGTGTVQANGYTIITSNDVINNLTTTITGDVLDASQGKALNDLISTKANSESPTFTGLITTTQGIRDISARGTGTLGLLFKNADPASIVTADLRVSRTTDKIVFQEDTGNQRGAYINIAAVAEWTQTMLYHTSNITISTVAPGSALAEGAQHQVY